METLSCKNINAKLIALEIFKRRKDVRYEEQIFNFQKLFCNEVLKMIGTYHCQMTLQ
jgi:hypothetical protein